MSSRIIILAQRIKQNPNDSLSKFALALEMVKNDNFTKARVLFENIIEHDPDYVGVYYHLGNLFEEINENILAKNIYKQGIEVAVRLRDNHAKSELQSALMNLEIDSN